MKLLHRIGKDSIIRRLMVMRSPFFVFIQFELEIEKIPKGLFSYSWHDGYSTSNKILVRGGKGRSSRRKFHTHIHLD